MADCGGAQEGGAGGRVAYRRAGLPELRVRARRSPTSSGNAAEVDASPLIYTLSYERWSCTHVSHRMPRSGSVA